MARAVLWLKELGRPGSCDDSAADRDLIAVKGNAGEIVRGIGMRPSWRRWSCRRSGPGRISEKSTITAW